MVGFSAVSPPFGDHVKKPGVACAGAGNSGRQVLRQLQFERQLDAIMASSVCHPLRPALREQRLDAAQARRPAMHVVPERATNLMAFLGQFAGFRRRWRSPSMLRSARRGKRSTACYGAVLRHRPFIRASMRSSGAVRRGNRSV